MKQIVNRIKNRSFQLAGSSLPLEQKPDRLIVEKARWYNNADSPVMLMIDDLANAWHSKNGNKTWDDGGDWGGGLSKERSAFSFLKRNILHEFPQIKVTFFAVAGKISHYADSSPFTFAEPLNSSPESKEFFRNLAQNSHFELAYHGYNHGIPGQTTSEFIQEWKAFKSIEEACKQIEKGKEIFHEVTGKYPSGGKYGGWDYNEFSDESIDLGGFQWWCRDWTPKKSKDNLPDSYYEPQLFGKSFVVAIPSTVHGSLWTKNQIRSLLKKKQIISIEEHIAPIRPDGLVQTPNIVDDVDRHRLLFSYLNKKNVWHATGAEIAKYFIAFSFTTIYDIKQNSFSITYTGQIKNPTLTIIMTVKSAFSRNSSTVGIITPNGREVTGRLCSNRVINRFLINIPVQNGTYRLIF